MPLSQVHRFEVKYKITHARESYDELIVGIPSVHVIDNGFLAINTATM
jgi:hypothetical protein